MYISFVYKLPMVINTYHSEPEVNLRSALFKKFEAFSDMKKYAMGLLRDFSLVMLAGHKNNHSNRINRLL